MNSTAIAIDLGGTAIKYGIITQAGDIRWNRVAATPTGSRTAVVARLIECAREARAADPGAICIGIGTPGLIDTDRGYVKGGAFQLPDWAEFPLAEWIAEQTGLPVFADNDANLMGLGEFRFGLEASLQTGIFFTIGTGIGGAIVLNGALYRGHFFAGAELGCFPFTWEGKQGYWEDFASAAALVAWYKIRSGAPDSPEINGEFIFRQAAQGDQAALDAISNHTRALGQGIGGYINIFNPEKIIIGGGLSESGPAYLEAIKKEALKWALPDCSRGVEIRAAALGNKAGLLGAGWFALEQMLDARC